MTETVSGVVTYISHKEISSDPGKMYSIKIDKEPSKFFSGFGECPYVKGDAVTFDYNMKQSGGKTYYNIVQKDSSVQKNVVGETVKKPPVPKDKIDAIIEYLARPHLTISVEKTVQENNYEPKKIALHLKVPISEATPETLEKFIELVESEVEKKADKIKKKVVRNEEEVFAEGA